MSRKRRSALLLASALVFGGIAASSLVSCGGTEQPGPSEQDEFTSLSIKNKADLQAKWTVGGEDRKLEITTEPSTNIILAISEGKVKITSSDDTVVSAQGVKLKALKAGTATITVIAGSLTDSVEIKVDERVLPTTTSIADILDTSKSNTGDVLSAKGEVVQIADGGFFISDAKDTFVYVFGGSTDGLAVGDTVYVVDGSVDNYGGVNQLKNPKEVFKHTEDDINVEHTVTTLTGEQLNTVNAKKTQVIDVTLTVLKEFKKDKFFWIAEGMNEKTVIYTGYVNANDLIKLNLKTNDRYHIKGLLNGKGSHNDELYNFSNRLNLYPITFEKVESIPVTGIKLTSKAGTTLKQNQSTIIKTEITPAGAAADVTFEIKEGAELVKWSGDDATTQKLIAKEQPDTFQGGVVKLVAKVGDVTSEELVINISKEKYVPVAISKLYESKAGETAYFYGKYLGQYAAEKNYGAIFGDGDSAVLCYGMEKGTLTVGKEYIVTGTTDIYSGLFQVKDAVATSAIEEKATETKTVELVSKNDFTGKDAYRPVKVSGTVVDDPTLDNYKNVKFKVKLANGEELSLKADSRYTSSDTLTALQAKKANDPITFEGNISFFKKNSTEVPTDGANLEVVNIHNVDGKEETTQVTPWAGTLTAGELFKDITGTSYKVFNGNHDYLERTWTTNQIMKTSDAKYGIGKDPEGKPVIAFQFQKKAGALSTKGISLKKVEFTLLSKDDYSSIPFEVSVGNKTATLSTLEDFKATKKETNYVKEDFNDPTKTYPVFEYKLVADFGAEAVGGDLTILNAAGAQYCTAITIA